METCVTAIFLGQFRQKRENRHGTKRFTTFSQGGVARGVLRGVHILRMPKGPRTYSTQYEFNTSHILCEESMEWIVWYGEWVNVCVRVNVGVFLWWYRVCDIQSMKYGHYLFCCHFLFLWMCSTDAKGPRNFLRIHCIDAKGLRKFSKNAQYGCHKPQKFFLE